MSKEEWTKELPRLRSRLDGKIGSVLKFSFDALDDEEKLIFLHIACLFHYLHDFKAVEYLEKRFPHVRQQLVVLHEKSLISTEHGVVLMHDLLRQLGRDIVRKQSIEPGQRQFLIDSGDITKVLNNNAGGNTSVTGITIRDKININERAFEGMSNLEFLRVGRRLSHGPSYLSPNLRLLNWYEFPLACLPSPVNLKFIVDLIMHDSKLEKLWEGNKSIRNLRRMDLSESKMLKELPNLSTATSLRELLLERCSSLVKLPSTIGKATNLQQLQLTGCSSLEKLPSSIGNATNLHMLELSYCSSLVKLPSSIGNLPKLRYLNCTGCSKLEVLPVNVNMKSLDILYLSGCSSLTFFPEISTNISELDLSGTAIAEVPSSIRTWFRLGKLILEGCKNLLSLPQLPESLRELKAVNCESLERLDSFCSNSNIDFNFANCFKLNQDARDLIIQTSIYTKSHVLPGKEIPAYFTHRANGACLVLKLNERYFPSKLKFKACILLVSKHGVEKSDEKNDVEDRDEGNEMGDRDEENDVEDRDEGNEMGDRDEENDVEDRDEENGVEDGDEDEGSEDGDEVDDIEDGDEENDVEDYHEDDESIEDSDVDDDSEKGYVRIMDKHNNLGCPFYDDRFDLQNQLTEHLYIFEFEADVPTHELFIEFSTHGDELVIKECGINFEDCEADIAETRREEWARIGDSSVIIDAISKYTSNNSEAGCSKSKVIEMSLDEEHVIKATHEHGEENRVQITNAHLSSEISVVPSVVGINGDCEAEVEVNGNNSVGTKKRKKQSPLMDTKRTSEVGNNGDCEADEEVNENDDAKRRRAE